VLFWTNIYAYKVKGQTIRQILNENVSLYNRPDFIRLDPIAIPHRFSKLQDIEIAGLFAAVFAWGQRVTILAKCTELIERMDEAPYDFIMGHSDADLKKLMGFKHRTFNDTDLLYFVHFLKYHYSNHASLETAFTLGMEKTDLDIGNGLIGFRNYFFSLPDFPSRTLKHIATPALNSACKRLCMYLRWLVRTDTAGVDFGLWKQIKPSQLICPLDVHSGRTARHFGLLKRPQDDWKAAGELTQSLSALDKNDPVKYDFALFGMGVNALK
jgi:uncharacterized protein (TIGR02757 family)